MKKTLIIFLLAAAIVAPLSAQQHGRGAILDEALYNSLPRKAAQLSRGLDSLPGAASLKQYAPFPGDQGQYGTCVAWATGYAARTIAESTALQRQDRAMTTGNVFSPVFVYKNISDDPSCQSGTAIPWALNLMKDPGIPRRSAAERSADFKTVPLSGYERSPKYPIAGYIALYSSRRGEAVFDFARVQAVKKSIAEGKPVIIGMNTPASFNRAKSPWQPMASPSINWGGHAMCVVGYDDGKHGGAFEIQNSWGEDWGEQGYIWIAYNVFAQFVDEAYEMLENLDSYKDATLYSGFVDIEVQGSDKGMPVRYDENGYYQTLSAYPSGTRFRFIMGNNHPAWVYAFTADSATTKTSRIFPLAERNESPVLDYSTNAVAWPGEHDWMQMDEVSGTDYLVVLYSKQELDIDAICGRFAAASGSFPERLARAVGSNFVPPSSAQYEKGRIRFSGSLENKRAVMGLLLAIRHE